MGALELRKDRRLFHPQANVERDADQGNREQEWDAPATVVEALLAKRVLDDQNHGKRDEITKGAGDLNETGVEAPPTIRRMLGDIDRGAAILATNRQALQRSYGDQNNWREPPGGRVSGQQANPSGRPAHDAQRHQKCIFAADQIADPTEEKRAEGPDDKTDGEGRQVGEIGEGGVARRIEQRRDDCRERAEDKEVIGLDQRSDGRSDDHAPEVVIARGESPGGRSAYWGKRRGVGHGAYSPMMSGAAEFECIVLVSVEHPAQPRGGKRSPGGAFDRNRPTTRSLKCYIRRHTCLANHCRVTSMEVPKFDLPLVVRFATAILFSAICSGAL